VRPTNKIAIQLLCSTRSQRRVISRCTTAGIIWPLEKKMISNSKQNCIAEISASARRSAVWRRELHAKYNDPRNGKAADTLDRLANEMHSMTDEDWLSLKPFYNWDSGKWSEAVSETSRRVGFRCIDTVPAFARHLARVLSQPSVAA